MEKDSSHEQFPYQEPSDYDLVREPSIEVLKKFHEIFNEHFGKFVRVGDELLIAPTIYRPEKGTILHSDIAEAGRTHPDESIRSHVEENMLVDVDNVQHSKSRVPITDAGQFTFWVHEGGVSKFLIFGESISFGRGNITERDKTVRLFSLLFSNDVEVRQED